jgi:hypothetical protein
MPKLEGMKEISVDEHLFFRQNEKIHVWIAHMGAGKGKFDRAG